VNYWRDATAAVMLARQDVVEARRAELAKMRKLALNK
jgi:hypothetical protein